MSDKCFVDTNILVYAYDKADPPKQETAENLMTRLIHTDCGVISAQVLNEFFYTMTQKIQQPMTPQEAKVEIERLCCFDVVDLDSSLTLKAIQIINQYKISFWDGLIVAAALAAECPVIYSEDLSPGQKFEKTTVVNIFKNR